MFVVHRFFGRSQRTTAFKMIFICKINSNLISGSYFQDISLNPKTQITGELYIHRCWQRLSAPAQQYHVPFSTLESIVHLLCVVHIMSPGTTAVSVSIHSLHYIHICQITEHNLRLSFTPKVLFRQPSCSAKTSEADVCVTRCHESSSRTLHCD